MKKYIFLALTFILVSNNVVTAQLSQIEQDLGFIYTGWSLGNSGYDFSTKSWPSAKIEDQKRSYNNGNIAAENIQVGRKLKRKQYFDDGKLFLEADIVQGPGIDTIIVFDPDTYAETRRVESIWSDAINGDFVEYCHNGAVKRKGKLKNATSLYTESDNIDYEQIEFHHDSKVLRNENIKEGKTIKRKQYFEDGKIQLEAEIKQVFNADTIVAYDPETYAETKRISKYFYDALDGNCIQYNLNGTIKRKGEVRNYKKVNHWIINNEDGNPLEDVTYNKDGLKDGKYTSFYPNGKIEKTGTYKVQLVKEKVFNPNTYGYEDGEVMKELQVGKWKYYKEDGTIKEEVDYK